MDATQNPFTPSAGARPPALVGRDDAMKEFGVALARLAGGRHARSTVLDGLRGVGKTVLLGEFDAMARGQGWISSGVVECNEDDDIRGLVAKLSHRALRALSRRRRTSDSVQRALGVLKAFTFTLDESLKWRFNIDLEAVSGVADSGDPETDIVELLGELGRAAAEQGAGVVFLLDEMQFLGEAELALLATAMHHISQETSPVLIAGAGLPQLPLMLGRARPYSERLFAYRTIGSLPHATAAKALTVPAERAGVTLDRDALDHVLDRAGGYPYFLQQWGEVVWNEAENDLVTLDDVLGAEDLVNDELDRRFFRDRYEKATEGERIYMAAMADLGDGPHSSAEIAQHMGVEQRKVSVRRHGLLKKGLIFKTVGSDLDFTVPQFSPFMRRTHVFDPAQRLSLGRKPRAVPAKP
jgi:hypothetical protein